MIDILLLPPDVEPFLGSVPPPPLFSSLVEFREEKICPR